ncbi:MAG: NACHT domain-containing protein [Deltaproteobacteria bacterium]|nr:NACHT domain-containing protein [Deltaproteobacteria bacterium]
MAPGRSLTDRLADGSDRLPYPLASACRKLLDAPPRDGWEEWERLSRDLLGPVVRYLAHLLLSDFVSTGRQPPQLFHRIQAVLGRPLAGHYVGFLRDTARYYRDEVLPCALPELLSFLLAADVDFTLAPDGKPLLGLLVDYRNLRAHGRFDNPAALDETVAIVRDLSATLLDSIAFLSRYPLRLEDGTPLMGAAPPGLSAEPRSLTVVAQSELVVRPLLLKLKGKDVSLLEDADLEGRRLVYRGASSFTKLAKKDLAREEGARLLGELQKLLEKVRAIDVELENADWSSFSERAAVLTDRTLALYREMGKYRPEWYIPRPAWHGNAGILRRFLDSERPLLAISGVQGTGKSALAAHLAQEAREAGHAVLFVNAQRFTFAKVAWSGNPYPDYFARTLHYQRPFDKEGFAGLLRSLPPGKQVLLFVDALNEVDGLAAKWNRFRAMELMLEWISSIAQPGLKVVLSFRADSYDDYDQLEGDCVPASIPGLAFPGNHPKHAWITEVEPFDESQAQALYEKLQGQPQHGMAPTMVWEEVLRGLGDKASELTSNPLLFMIFLRCHHRETRVLTSDREKLFLRYADKVTGADLVRQWPWWRKVLGFLRNGLITPRENVLADVVAKTMERGGAAFLHSQLSPPRMKHDRRLLAALAEPGDSPFAALKDAGVLIEEKIEEHQADSIIHDRRVSFVAEIMTAAIAGLARRRDFRKKLAESLLFFSTASIVLVGALAMVLQSTTHKILSLFVSPWNVFRVAFVGLIVFLVAYLVTLLIAALLDLRPAVDLHDIGLVPFSVVSEGYRAHYPRFLTATLGGSIALVLLWGTRLALDLPGADGWALPFLCAIALPLAAAMTPCVSAPLLLSFLQHAPRSLVRASMRRRAEWFSSPASARRASSRRLLALARGIPFACAGVATYWYASRYTPASSPVYSARELVDAHRTIEVWALGGAFAFPKEAALIASIGLAALIALFTIAADWSESRASQLAARVLSGAGRIRSFSSMVGRVVVSQVILAVCVLLLSLRFPDQELIPAAYRTPNTYAASEVHLCGSEAALAVKNGPYRTPTRAVVDDACSALGEQMRSFPGLTWIGIDEETVRQLGSRFPGCSGNTVLDVYSAAGPTLEWLGESHRKCVLRLRKPPTVEASALDRIERLMLPAAGLDPEMLQSARRLRWLVLVGSPADPQGEWYSRLRRVAESKLPHLEALSVVGEHWVGGGDFRLNADEVPLRMAIRADAAGRTTVIDLLRLLESRGF